MGNCFTIPANNARQSGWQFSYYPTFGQNNIQFSPSGQAFTVTYPAYPTLPTPPYPPTYRATLSTTHQPTLQPTLPPIQPPACSPIHLPNPLPTTLPPTTCSLDVSAPPACRTQPKAGPPGRASYQSAGSSTGTIKNINCVLDRPYCSTDVTHMKRAIEIKRYLIK